MVAFICDMRQCASDENFREESAVGGGDRSGIACYFAEVVDAQSGGGVDGDGGGGEWGLWDCGDLVGCS